MAKNITKMKFLLSISALEKKENFYTKLILAVLLLVVVLLYVVQLAVVLLAVVQVAVVLLAGDVTAIVVVLVMVLLVGTDGLCTAAAILLAI